MATAARANIVGGTAVAILAFAGVATAQPLDLPMDELAPHFSRKTQGQVYTGAMLELGLRRGAATTVALNGDPDRAQESRAIFREQFDAVAEMVPSWGVYFPTHPLDELEAALASGADVETRRAQTQRIERICTNCHVRYLFPVQALFRWGQFDKVQVEGDDGEEWSLHRIMTDLAVGLGALRSLVATGRID